MELCCGQRNGLHSLSKLGFTRLAGVDLSAALIYHLKTLPDDLQQTLSEAARVLRDNGAFVVVEPLVNYFLGLCPYSMSKQDR